MEPLIVSDNAEGIQKAHVFCSNKHGAVDDRRDVYPPSAERLLT